MVERNLNDIEDELLGTQTEELSEESTELYEHFRIIADKGQTITRVDKFLQNRIENVSRNRIQQAAKAGSIFVNDKVVKQNYKVKPNDVVSVVLSYPPREVEIIPEDIPINIVYEDDDIVIVNKQAGLVVHPGHGNFNGTLLNALAYHFKETRQNVENGFGYLVHRIDKDTTGLMIVAKNETAQTILAKQFFEHSITRRYQALVWGDFNEDEGTIEGHIGRSLKDRIAMAVFPDASHGKSAVTHYKVLEHFNYVTLVECRLETGRTHQIRVHFQHIGHPLFNDYLYGGDAILKGTTFTKYRQFIENCFREIPRHCLHAKILGFVHPTTGETMYFDSELPSDMVSVLDKWRNYIKTRTE
ncbi:MAG: RluA family pseudouridine synthase [Lentimicrobiaceae bacterium]|nr:RluA family pseudouridine synthase [Lentimicrobiaceae bacterium]